MQRARKKGMAAPVRRLLKPPVLALLPPSRAGDDASATDAVIDSHICACGWVERGLCKMQHSSGRSDACDNTSMQELNKVKIW